MVLIGRITKDANIKKLKDGREVVNFSIAINDWYKPKGSEQGVTITTFYNCSYWLSTKVAPLLTKGTLVEIHGWITVFAYKSLDGEAKASLNCHVNTVTIHHHKKADSSVAPKEEVVDDLPF